MYYGKIAHGKSLWILVSQILLNEWNPFAFDDFKLMMMAAGQNHSSGSLQVERRREEEEEEVQEQLK